VRPQKTDGEGKQETLGWSRRTVVISAIVFVVVLGAISITAGTALEREGLPRLVERLRAFGDHWWAPLALIAAFVVVNMTGIPGTPLTLAAGVVWGWLFGGFWVMTSIMIGTAVPYLITRQRVPRLRQTIENSFGTLSHRLRGHGVTNVALLRLVHVFPFAAISYAAGLAGVKLRDYLIGTFIGTLPGVLIYTYLADAILSGLVSPEQAALRIGIAAVLLVALIVVSRWLGRKVNR
jgi:uncharacterized membrane protein YdjX (TVP38/TMEM64 family)